MIDISLLEFFRTGQFGPVSLGMKRAEVIALLGEPDVVGYGRLELLLCKYGDIEFQYYEESGELALIWCDYFPFPGEESRNVRLDQWIFADGNHPSKEDIETGLAEHGIQFTYTAVEPEEAFVPGFSLTPLDEEGGFEVLTQEPSGEFWLDSGVGIGMGHIVSSIRNGPPKVVKRDVVVCISKSSWDT